MKKKIEVDWLYGLFLSNEFLKNGLNKGKMKIVCEVYKNDYFGKWVDLLYEEGIFKIVGYTENKHPIFSSSQKVIIKKLRTIPRHKSFNYPVCKFDTETF